MFALAALYRESQARWTDIQWSYPFVHNMNIAYIKPSDTQLEDILRFFITPIHIHVKLADFTPAKIDWRVLQREFCGRLAQLPRTSASRDHPANRRKFRWTLAKRTEADRASLFAYLAILSCLCLREVRLINYAAEQPARFSLPPFLLLSLSFSLTFSFSVFERSRSRSHECRCRTIAIRRANRSPAGFYSRHVSTFEVRTARQRAQGDSKRARARHRWFFFNAPSCARAFTVPRARLIPLRNATLGKRIK